MGKKKKSSPSPTVKKNNLKHNIFQIKGNHTTNFQIDANLELINDDLEQNTPLINEETVVKEIEDNKQDFPLSTEEEETTTKEKEQKNDLGTKDGRLITKDEEELKEVLMEEKTTLVHEETEEVKDDNSEIEENVPFEKEQFLEIEQKHLEKEYNKTSLKERIWLTTAPLAVLGLLAYYANIGFLALQDSTVSIKDDTTTSVDSETPSTESETEEPMINSEEITENQTEETPVEPITPETQEPKTYKGFSNYKSLNVRSEPSQTSKIVGSLRLNQEVEILELATETLNWHKINYNGQEAYVREDFITIPDQQ